MAAPPLSYGVAQVRGDSRRSGSTPGHGTASPGMTSSSGQLSCLTESGLSCKDFFLVVNNAVRKIDLFIPEVKSELMCVMLTVAAEFYLELLHNEETSGTVQPVAGPRSCSEIFANYFIETQRFFPAEEWFFLKLRNCRSYAVAAECVRTELARPRFASLTQLSLGIYQDLVRQPALGVLERMRTRFRHRLLNDEGETEVSPAAQLSTWVGSDSGQYPQVNGEDPPALPPSEYSYDPMNLTAPVASSDSLMKPYALCFTASRDRGAQFSRVGRCSLLPNLAGCIISESSGLWYLPSGQSAPGVRLVGHIGVVTAMDVFPMLVDASAGVLVGTSAGHIYLYTRFVETTESVAATVQYLTHVGPVLSVAANYNNNHFATGGADRTVRVWTTASTKPLVVFAGHYSPIVALAWHPSAQLLLSASEGGVIRVWDINNPSRGTVAQIDTQKSITCLAVSRGGRWVFAGTVNGEICRCDLISQKFIGTVKAHDSMVSALAVPNIAPATGSALLASAGFDSTVKIWPIPGLVKSVGDKVMVEPLAVLPMLFLYPKDLCYTVAGETLTLGVACTREPIKPQHAPSYIREPEVEDEGTDSETEGELD